MPLCLKVKVQRAVLVEAGGTFGVANDHELRVKLRSIASNLDNRTSWRIYGGDDNRVFFAHVTLYKTRAFNAAVDLTV